MNMIVCKFVFAFYFFINNKFGQEIILRAEFSLTFWNISNFKLEMLLIPNFEVSESYQLREDFSLFCNLIALYLVWNSVKNFRVTKIVKEVKFGGVWHDLVLKKRDLEKTSWKMLETNSSFHVK